MRGRDRSNPIADQRAKALRRLPTVAERRLWEALRSHQLDGAKFRRQAPVGPYIVDFICPSAHLVVEIDGGQHASTTNYDAKRERYLEEQGFRVIRFWNNEVLENLDGVLARLQATLAKQHPSP